MNYKKRATETKPKKLILKLTKNNSDITFILKLELCVP